MSRGKNINLFLMDGDASGRIKCTLANWTGVAYKILALKSKNAKIVKSSNGVASIFFLEFPMTPKRTSPI